MREECWVTVCESDVEGWGAAGLGRSIRKTLTSKKLVVAISENVSPPIKVLLQRIYDAVFRFDSIEIGRKVGGKLWIWNLHIYSKCVFLDPFSLLLRNSDELFEKPSFSAALSSSKVGQFESSIFVFKPSLKTFEELLEVESQVIGGGNVENILNSYFPSVSTTSKFQINSSYSTIICDFTLFDSTLNSSIVVFSKLPWKVSGAIPVVKNIGYKWVGIFVHEVIPKIQQIKNAEIRNWLYEYMETHDLPTTNGPVISNSMDDSLDELDDAIAVVGMSCRFPGANTLEEFWSLLVEGVDPIGKFPSQRPANFKNFAGENSFKAGFLKCPVDEFDAKFFGISPREAPYVDPQQRLLLEVLWESLENANIAPQNLKGSDTGIFLGIWQQDYDKMLPDFGLSANSFHHRYLGNAFSATASRISYFLGLYGPNYAIESGCSSSSSGVHLAVQSLRRGEISLAIASGVNLVLRIFNPLGGGDDKDVVVLASDYKCKTFDESADGFVRAEGCGSLVLKRYSDALRDGENIHGIIRGTALNNDGPGTSFGTPNGHAQTRVFKEALADAKVEPWEVSFVEAHGTGTAVGDPIEMWAISEVYSSERVDPLWVSSVKTNIGHAEACAGIAGLIKVLLCFKHDTLPPHLHLKSLNPRIDLEKIPAKIPIEATPWTQDRKIAAVSSFSMSGTNVHIIVQQTPKQNPKHTSLARKEFLQMIGISAKTEDALDAMCQCYVSWLHENKNTPLQDIAYSLNTGRAHMPHRIGVVAKDTAQLLAKLDKRSYLLGKAPIQKPKIVFLFTGQGCQYFGMAKNIYYFSPIFHTALDACDDLFRLHFGVTLKEVLWKNPELLEKTVYCQPAIFCVEYSLYCLWTSLGITPDFVLGHSVGEFCAAVAAGVLSLSDAMTLVVGRSKLVESLPLGGMLAVKTSYLETTRLISAFSKKYDGVWLDVAASNSAEETVVSSLPDTIRNFSLFAAAEGVKTQQVNASHGFHSRQMDPILDDFCRIASGVSIGNPICSYISATLAKEITADDFCSGYWVRHLREKVKFQEAFKNVWDMEGRVLLEIGVQPILLSLAMGNVTDSTLGIFCPSLRKNEDDESSILTSISKLYVGGINISWKNWFTQETKKVVLPTYPFQRQKFWFYPEEGSEWGCLQPSTLLLHPLLGHQMASPLRDKIFANVLNRKQLSYVEDHKVGERVILPAAAYLESIMAAGSQVLQGGRVQIPFSVENFEVEAALDLEKPAIIQTVLNSTGGEQGVEFFIGIHRQLSKEQADHWKRHAIGTFKPATRAAVPTVNLEYLMKRMDEKDSIRKAYEGIAKVGISFGPKFQSIQRAWKGDEEILTQVAQPEDGQKYICHPILLDAMIQTFAFRFALISNQSEPEAELQLPIAVRNFTWLSREISNELYIYTHWKGEMNKVILYSSTGEALAVMEGIELIKTNVNVFLRSLHSDSTIIPPFWEEVWRPTSGITRSRIDPKQLEDKNLALTNTWLAGEMEQYKNEYQVGTNIIDKLFFLYLIRSIQECQWPWKNVGEFLELKIWSTLAPAGFRIAHMESFLQLFENKGYVKKRDGGLFEVLQDLPNIDDVEREIKNNFKIATEIFGEEDAYILFTKRCGNHLTSVLQGKMTPLAYMFPEDSNEVGAIRFYNESSFYKMASTIGTKLMADALSPFAKGHGGVVRILEVGAGSGISSQAIVDHLTNLGINYHYTFTDISPYFIQEAQKKFTKNFSFEIFNIEEDPLGQGFAPNQFDVIIAAYVVHATKDVVETLANLNILLRDDGMLILPDYVNEWPNAILSFAFLDGWWRFEDFRKNSPIIYGGTWKTVFEKCGFYKTQVFEFSPESYGAIVGRKDKFIEPGLSAFTKTVVKKSWYVVGDGSELDTAVNARLSTYGRNVISSLKNEAFQLPLELEGILYFCTTSTEPWTLETDNSIKLLQLLQNITSTYQEVKAKPKVILVTHGVNYIGDASAGNPNGAILQAMMKSFCNESSDFRVTIIDLDQDELNLARATDEVFAQLWAKHNEIFKAIREDKIFVQRLVACDHRQIIPLPIPNSNRFTLFTPTTKNIGDLEIIAAPKSELTGSDVEVVVRACALNFKDILVILQPEGFEIPDHISKLPGLDIAGLVSNVGPDVKKWAVGDAVFGFTSNNGLSSHVVVSENAIIRKPEGMTFTTASTIPCAFLTVFYSLVECAKIRQGDRVLIHVAIGGVGLAAIQVARRNGAVIYATAGSKRKRTYLRSIGIQHVYHSRNTDFGSAILRDTNGEGVTVVLNSLTGPNFKERTLEACAQGARFVEIGKVNIWTVEDVQTLRPDVQYFIVDLAEMACNQSEELMKYTDAIGQEFKKGLYHGLPHDTFPYDLVKEAFNYFQKAKHIGKVVVRIPQVKTSPEGRYIFSSPLFDSEGTYLITGGLGGIGMEVLIWMIEKGASNIILAGRSLATEKHIEVIRNLRFDGRCILIIHADIAEREDCRNILKTVNDLKLPTLRGIMHGAGVLNDAIIPNQTKESYNKVMRPKVQGLVNLHDLTLDIELEFFCMFSSVAAIIGPPGQSNHAGANGFMDSFSQYRHAYGLHANTINFGAWAEVGAAATIKHTAYGLLGVRGFNATQGLVAMDKIFRERLSARAVVDMNDWRGVKQIIRLGKYFDEIRDTSNDGEAFEEDRAIIEDIKTSSPDQTQAKIENFLENILKQTLRIPKNEYLDRDQNFSEIGVDSLIAMELRNRLQGMMGEKQLTVSAFQENRTIRSLSRHMAILINGGNKIPIDNDQLVHQDSILPAEICATEILPTKPSEWTEILLTGCTGHLGIHFIHAILSQNKAITIRCAVRGKDSEHATLRLNNTLKEYGLLEFVDFNRLKISAIDLSKENFALTLDEYMGMADSVDAIIHCAVKSNHVDDYGDGVEDSIRSHNVLATVAILKFAGTRKTKTVLYTSSLIAVTMANEDGLLSEQFPAHDAKCELKNGYAASKFVSEKLVCEAILRGIPCTVIRYASIMGQSETGFMPLGYNHSWNILLSCIRVRSFPRLQRSGIPIMAVDTAANISTRIFLADNSERGMYNLTCGFITTEEDVMFVFREFGVEGEFIPFKEWRNLVFEESGVDENVLRPLMSLYGDDDNEEMHYLSLHPLARKIPELDINKWSEKLRRNCPTLEEEVIPTKTLLRRYLQFHFQSIQTQ